MRNVTPHPILQYTGGKISRPGIYANVPIKTYHGDLCIGPSISSGGLRKIESKNIAHFYKEYYGNPNRKPPKEKEAWVFGRAAHTLLLGEAGFREDFLIRPETYPDDPSKPWHGGSAACKKWLGEAELAKKSVLKPEDVPNIQGMADALAAHPVIEQGILNGLVEHSIIWRRRIKVQSGRLVTIWVKARPDAVPIDANMIVDYKTCDDASPDAVRRAISEHLYNMQLALGAEGFMATTGRQITDFALPFQEKAEPWSINIKPINAMAIEWGHRQNQRALMKFAEAIDTGNWSEGYEDDGVEVGLTDRLEKRLAREAEEQLLPPIDLNPDFGAADDDEIL